MSEISNVTEPHLTVYQHDKAQDFLRKIVIFKDLSPKSLKVIENQTQTLSFKKGEQIFSEVDEAQGVFFVKSGVVKLSKQAEDGNEIIVCLKQTGEVFAEACLFSKIQECYPATATMMQEGVIYFLDKLALEKELYNYPELAIQMISYMSEQLREMTSTLRDVVLLDVYAKTIKTLERLGRKFSHSQRCDIEIPLTVQEFANVVGTSRESVSRVFSKLKKQEMIDLRARKIIILDWCKFCTLFHSKF
ncbi:Crp/Fnr family transcriptional regulator [Neobacillus sp. PS3-40]|uniref:Crp/Fnr family transcriptional regulator n=1 Tax=Neobacillus sp. PS3-40 TaxID=3070679 RepID=UPI0027E01D59|nr:Crp/Fnr family transcriptional regulator [Neobacillus sp. PS3-40]WML46304.1 Crp/Fnr family transcriptional regulator [Neobacillus sp. PS3-40]